jgi:hypothetical protein
VVNKVVARFRDGGMVKGSTSDFIPAKESFHVAPSDAPVGAKPRLVHVKDLKAIFFVKDFDGRPDYTPTNEFDSDRVPAGSRKIRVVFTDNEVLVGTTQGYNPGRSGFFMVPADRAGNNIERCYVVTASTKEVTPL